VPTARGDLLHSIVGLLQGDTTLGDSDQYVRNIFRTYAGWKGPEGFLQKRLSTEYIPGAARARIVQRQATSARQFMMGSSDVIDDVFTIGMGSTDVRQMISNISAQDKDLYEQLTKQLNKNNYIYGAIRPTPTHGAGHYNVVKIAIDDALNTMPGGKRHVAMHPWLAQYINRDLDKDVIDVMTLGKTPAGVTKPADILRRQYKLASSQVDAWQDAMRQLDESIATPGALNASEAAFRYFMFGNAPPLSFAASYPVEAFGSAITSKATQEEISNMINSVAKGRLEKSMDPQKVELYNKAMGGRAAFGRVMSFQRNLHQMVITKGTDIGTVADELLGISGRIAEDIQGKGQLTPAMIEAAVEQATTGARNVLMEATATASGRRDISRLKIDAPYRGTSDEILEAVSRDIGRVYGVSAAAMAHHFKPGKSMPNLLREGLSQVSSGLMGIFNMLFGTGDLETERVNVAEDIDIFAAPGEKQGAQVSAAAANVTVQEAGSEVGTSARSWIKKNWRLAAGAAAALVALRAIGQGTASMPEPARPEAPTYPNAPLPQSPMVGVQEESAPQFAPPTATIMPGSSYSNYSQGSITTNSVNIPDVLDTVALNVGAVNGSHSTININDHRRYTSNWEMHNMSDRLEDSDFIHPYMS
jgi:hypothetical protein